MPIRLAFPALTKAVAASFQTSESAAATATPTVVLRARSGWAGFELGNLLRYRDLLWFLALRDIQVRYKQTILGALWAVIQPLVLMIVFRFFLGRYTGMTDPVELYAGLLPWTFFAATVTASSNSLVSNAALLNKVYFPRIILPIAAVGAPLMDYAIAFVVLIGMMFWFAVALSWSLLLLPLLIISTIIAAVGMGIFLAAMTVSYRDFRYVVPFMIQVWFFITPVIYHVPDWTMRINPMGGTIHAFRAAVLGQPIDYSLWACSAGLSVIILAMGLCIFSRTERKFADVV